MYFIELLTTCEFVLVNRKCDLGRSTAINFRDSNSLPQLELNVPERALKSVEIHSHNLLSPHTAYSAFARNALHFSSIGGGPRSSQSRRWSARSRVRRCEEGNTKRALKELQWSLHVRLRQEEAHKSLAPFTAPAAALWERQLTVNEARVAAWEAQEAFSVKLLCRSEARDRTDCDFVRRHGGNLKPDNNDLFPRH